MTQNTFRPELIEEGAAFMHLAAFDAPSAASAAGAAAASRTHATAREPERVPVVVIGGGQAGLSVGYHLQRRGVRCVILDAEKRIGDVWRNRWDSLHLFSPNHLNGLDGMPFPGPLTAFPSKDQMADYLEAYAKRFALPVRSGLRVERVSRRGDRYLVQAGEREFEAEQVVVAMSSYQKQRLPSFAAELDPRILQLHSSDYRSLDQLRPGGVLIAGAGNSGAELAVETARAHRTWVAGRDTGSVPFKITAFLGRTLLCRLLLRVVFHHLLTVNTPFGRKARPKILAQGGPLIRTRPAQLMAAGVERVPRVTGARAGLPVLEDGRVLEVANVIWCTGFDSGLSFIELPIFDERGALVHRSGVAPGAPGLYFVGQNFLHAMSSGMIHGVGRDAARIASQVAARVTAQHHRSQTR
jgi:putative flavoprotein involved in K+ transport